MKSLTYDNYIFTEAGEKIGFGHLTRCMALYDELVERELKPLLIINGEEPIHDILGTRRFEIDYWYTNWQKYLNNGNTIRPNCIIDSYIADANLYYMMQKSCNKALFIDDTNRIAYPEGIIVNPSIYGNRIPYVKQDRQLYLTGIEYVILRSEFRDGYQRDAIDELKKVLVILGGSDIKNLMPTIIRVLCELESGSIEKHIVIGKGFTNIKDIENISRGCQDIKLYYNLNAAQLSELMKQCDFAITAAGQTIYELIAMQLPFVCIKVIENQSNNLKGLISNHIISDYFDFPTNQNNQEVGKYIEECVRIYKAETPRRKQILEMKKSQIGKGVELIIDTLISERA